MTIVTEANFVAAIIQNPAEDGIRLIAADWLEENGQSERAEFIRIQCELAKPCRFGYSDAHHVDDFCPACDPLSQRERELVSSQNPFPFLKQCFRLYSSDSAELIYRCQTGAWVIRCVFHRGFVAEITCTLADWMGKECNKCGAAKGYWPGRILAADMNESNWQQCPTCHGTGRVGGHGPAIVRAVPLERVVLTDKRPNWLLGFFYWRTESSQPTVPRSDPCVLPDKLFQFLDHPGVDWSNLGVAMHSNQEEAYSKLSAALIAHAQGENQQVESNSEREKRILYGDPAAPKPQGIINVRRKR